MTVSGTDCTMPTPRSTRSWRWPGGARSATSSMCSISTTPTCRWERWRGPAAARTPALPRRRLGPRLYPGLLAGADLAACGLYPGGSRPACAPETARSRRPQTTLAGGGRTSAKSRGGTTGRRGRLPLPRRRGTPGHSGSVVGWIPDAHSPLGLRARRLAHAVGLQPLTSAASSAGGGRDERAGLSTAGRVPVSR